MRVTKTFQMAYMQRIFVNEIEFENVIVPEEHVIHDPKAIYNSMMLARVHILAGKIGHVERCLDHLRPFVAAREISTGPMAQEPQCTATHPATRAFRGNLQALLEYSLREEETEGTSYDLAMVCKIVGVLLAMEGSRTLQSLYGARGLDPRSGIPAVADDVRVWTVMEGSSEPMQHFLAANYLTDKPWIRRFVATHPDCFAALRPMVATHSPELDMAVLGEAISWAVARVAPGRWAWQPKKQSGCLSAGAPTVLPSLAVQTSVRLLRTFEVHHQIEVARVTEIGAG